MRRRPGLAGTRMANSSSRGHLDRVPDSLGRSRGPDGRCAGVLVEHRQAVVTDQGDPMSQTIGTTGG